MSGYWHTQDSIVEYETEIKAGKFMFIANGTDVEVRKVRKTLESEESVIVYDIILYEVPSIYQQKTVIISLILKRLNGLIKLV